MPYLKPAANHSPRVLLMAIIVVTTISCSTRTNPADRPTAISDLADSPQGLYIPPYGQGVRGYTEPFPENTLNGIGLRAVTWDRWLAISVRNHGDESLFLEPEAFRLLMPDRSLYAIGQDRHRMGLFTPTEIVGGDTHAFIARLPELDNLKQLDVILNYPPRDVILRASIEPTPDPGTIDDMPPPTP